MPPKTKISTFWSIQHRILHRPSLGVLAPRGASSDGFCMWEGPNPWTVFQENMGSVDRYNIATWNRYKAERQFKARDFEHGAHHMVDGYYVWGDGALATEFIEVFITRWLQDKTIFFEKNGSPEYIHQFRTHAVVVRV